MPAAIHYAIFKFFVLQIPINQRAAVLMPLLILHEKKLLKRF